MKEKLERVRLVLITPDRERITSELDNLIVEWRNWMAEIEKIEDHPYDKNTQSEVFKDGEENMKKHRILQTKTLTFLDNNIEGHGFIGGIDGRGCDRTDLRLRIRVRHRIDDLDELRARLSYAKVPDAYWTAKGKELVDKVIAAGADKGVDIAASYLRRG